VAERAGVRFIQAQDRGPGLGSGLRELWQYRELAVSWALRDIRVRYKQSVLGAAWAILQPLLMMLIFTAVFGLLVKVPSEGFPYPIFSYTALLPWTFFATSVSFGVPSVVTNMNLVTKIYFPREIFPIAAIGAGFVDLLIASIVFAVMIIVYRVPVGLPCLIVPLLLAVQIVLTLGVVLLAAALNVRYRDVRFVVPVAVQLLMYASPVVYPASLVPERWRVLYMLNPMAGLIDGYRTAVLKGQWPEAGPLTLAAAVSMALFLLGYWVFKRMEVEFADII
jgi:lipopolysaccharide transport system permease protein